MAFEINRIKDEPMLNGSLSDYWGYTPTENKMTEKDIEDIVDSLKPIALWLESIEKKRNNL